jgi:hypothetical protein
MQRRPEAVLKRSLRSSTWTDEDTLSPGARTTHRVEVDNFGSELVHVSVESEADPSGPLRYRPDGANVSCGWRPVEKLLSKPKLRRKPAGFDELVGSVQPARATEEALQVTISSRLDHEPLPTPLVSLTVIVRTP